MPGSLAPLLASRGFALAPVPEPTPPTRAEVAWEYEVARLLSAPLAQSDVVVLPPVMRLPLPAPAALPPPSPPGVLGAPVLSSPAPLVVLRIRTVARDRPKVLPADPKRPPTAPTSIPSKVLSATIPPKVPPTAIPSRKPPKAPTTVPSVALPTKPPTVSTAATPKLPAASTTPPNVLLTPPAVPAVSTTPPKVPPAAPVPPTHPILGPISRPAPSSDPTPPPSPFLAASSHVTHLVRDVPRLLLPHAHRVAAQLCVAPPEAAAILATHHLVLRVHGDAPSLYTFGGEPVGTNGPVLGEALSWSRAVHLAQIPFLPGYANPTPPPLDAFYVPSFPDSIPLFPAREPAPLPPSSPPSHPPPLAISHPAPSLSPVLGGPGSRPGAPRMVVTDGSNLTGGKAKRREQQIRRDGGVVPPPPVFDDVARQIRIDERAGVIAAKRLRRCDRLASTRLLDRLLLEAPSVLVEVHGTGWSPKRWVPFIFPSSLHYDPEALSSGYLTPAMVWSYVQYAPPTWRDILERIAGLADATPLGLRGLFDADCLAHIDAFGALFAPVPKRPPWLVAVVQRLRALRSELPVSVEGGSPSRPSQSLRGLLRHGPQLAPDAVAAAPGTVAPTGPPTPPHIPELTLPVPVLEPTPRKPRLTFSQRIARRFDELRARDIGFAFPLKPL